MSSVSTTNEVVLDKERQRLAHNSVKAIAGTVLSRACGVIRTLVINATFGATTTLDAFNVAFRFPNSLRDLFADGALSAAFVKVLVDTAPEGEAATRQLISVITGFFLTITLLLAIMGMVFAKPFMTFISGSQFAARGSLQLGSVLFQVLVFYLPLTMLNAIVMGVLGLKGDTFRAMNGSIFLSVGMILGAVVLAPMLHQLNISSMMGLAIGAMLGALLQLIYQAYPLRKWKLLVWPNFNPVLWWHYIPLHKVLGMMAPRALGQGALVLALMINTFFAIQIGAGVFTYVTTTVIIIQVPIGLFGVATGFAALPLLTAAFNNTNKTLFNHLLEESLSAATWLSLFTLLGFALFIVPLYLIIFQHGKITFYDTLQNSTAICAYGIGIFFAANGKVLLNALYAVNATRQIIINSLAYLVVNATLSALLAPHLGVVGLGVSFASATAVDCWLNYLVIRRAAQRQFAGIDANSPSCFFFTPRRLFLFSIVSYLLGFSGVLLCYFFWPHFTTFTKLPLNFPSAMLILSLGGGLLIMLFILLARQYGPQQLKGLIKKLF